MEQETATACTRKIHGTTSCTAVSYCWTRYRREERNQVQLRKRISLSDVYYETKETRVGEGEIVELSYYNVVRSAQIKVELVN